MNIYNILTAISSFAFGWYIMEFTKTKKQGFILLGLFILSNVFDKLQ